MLINQYTIPLLGLILIIGIFLGSLALINGNPPLRKIVFFWICAIGFHNGFLVLRLIQFIPNFVTTSMQGSSIDILIQGLYVMAACCVGLFFKNLRNPQRIQSQAKILLFLFLTVFLTISTLLLLRLDASQKLVVVMFICALLYSLYEMYQYSRTTADRLIYLLLFTQICLIVVTLVGSFLILTNGQPFGFINHVDRAIVEKIGLIRVLQILIFALIYFYITTLLATISSKTIEYKIIENKNLKKLSREKDALILSLEKNNKFNISGALSASLAHELSQPLASIQVNCELLQLKLKDKSTSAPQLEDMADKIILATQRAGKILWSLKALFSRESEPQLVVINDLVDSCCELLRSQLKNTNVHLSVNLGPSLKTASINAQELRQVLLNLLINAHQAIEDALIESGKITVTTAKVDGRIHIKISDNGGGVPPEQTSQIFELLKTSKKGGMGFGLWLSRYILEANAGYLWLQNEPGFGATFIIDLPLSVSIGDIPRSGDSLIP